jgi:hypothetical protein
MQDHEPSTLGSWPEDLADRPLPRQPASLWDFLSRDHDDVLMVREPYGDRSRTILLSTIALVASFALGWAGGLSWPEYANVHGLSPISQKETPSPPTAEVKSVGRIEGTRKTASTFDLHTAAPAVVGSIPKAQAAPAGGARPSAGPALQVNAAPAGVAIATRPPLAAAPETRPTTIPGWAVVDVRDGTAVLEGPDGIRMAARGDTIPGIGRVESIVRWGSRWIVATANGLIATP